MYKKVKDNESNRNKDVNINSDNIEENNINNNIKSINDLEPNPNLTESQVAIQEKNNSTNIKNNQNENNKKSNKNKLLKYSFLFIILLAIILSLYFLINFLFEIFSKYDLTPLDADFIDFNPDNIHIEIPPFDNPSKIKAFPLNKKSDAKCLDGSDLEMYYTPGHDSGKNKVYIGFEGNGFCGVDKDSIISDKCSERLDFYYGSSKTWKNEYIYDSNNLSGNEEKNPQFFNWHRFLIPYCDGTGNQGYVKDPVQSDGKDLYFRGFRNTVEGFKFIFQHIDLKNTDIVVLWGCSSGAWTNFQWIDNIERYVKSINPKAKVLGIMNAGFFINYKSSKTKDENFLKKFKNFYNFVNKESPIVNKKCLKDFKEEPYKCLFPEIVINYIKTPILMFQPQYDSWQIPRILEVDCITDKKTLDTCNDKEKKEIIAMRDYTKILLKNIIEKNPNVSMFSQACVMHCYLDYIRKSKDLMVGNYTVSDLLTEYIENKGEKRFVLFDDVDWPNNKGCLKYNQP